MTKNYFSLTAIFVLCAMVFVSCSKDDDFEIDKPISLITMTTVASEVTLWIVGSGEMTIDWGDGTVVTYSLSSGWSRPEHRYFGTSAHIIRISGGNITELSAVGNQLTALDVNNSIALEYLDVHRN